METKAMPRVSICITSYNYANYLPITLDSILCQTFQDFEIIVVDDASQDDSQAVAEGYASRYPGKVKIYTHPGRVNKGISATCNLAIEKSQGEYLAWLGSDDVWYPEKLARQVEELDKRPEIGMTYSYANIIDSKGVKTGEMMGKDMTDDLLPMLIAGNFVPHLTALHRRACFEKTGLYDENLQYSDWEMWLKMANFYPISFIDRPLAMYRVHGINMYTGSTQEARILHNLAVVDKIIKARFSGPLSLPKNQALLAFRKAHLHFQLNQIELAKSCIRRSFEIDPGLGSEGRYLSNWLSLFNAEVEFGLFAASCFPQTDRDRSKFEAEQFAKAAIYYRSQDIVRAKSYAIQSLSADLSHISDPQLVGIILQASTPPWVYQCLRSLRQLIAGKGLNSVS
jgi:glycosyltransferase involved in cell wall biosynthesis